MEMNNLLLGQLFNKIPIAEKTELATEWITEKFSFLFTPIKKHIGRFMEWTAEMLNTVPPIAMINIVAILAFLISGKRFGLAVFYIVGLLIIENQGYWGHLMDTFSLVLIASLLLIIIEVTVGILMSNIKIADTIIMPNLDFMQSMLDFVS